MTLCIPTRVSGAKDLYMDVIISREDEKTFGSTAWRIYVQKASKRRTVQGYFNGKSTYLSHVLVGKPPEGQVVDHIDNNTLNNARSNLRFASFALNAQNRIKQHSTSGYRGVYASGSRWAAACRGTHLGCFATPAEAARQYDAYVVSYYGPGATTNMKDEPVIEFHFPPRHVCKLPTGVRQIRSSPRYMAVLSHKSLGTFDCIEAASTAYRQAVREKMKEQQATLSQVPITCNEDDIPVIPVTRAKQVVAYLKCDADTWHDLSKSKYTLTAHGYPQTRRHGKTVLAHRYVIRAKPGQIVDHINRDRCDARLHNLRFVTASENAKNRG